MKTSDFIDCLKNQKIPPSSPDGLVSGGWTDWSCIGKNIIDDMIQSGRARIECMNVGMWAIIDQEWTKYLAQWIDNRTCLEVMSGAGWLAKALSMHGIDIIATDNDSWCGVESMWQFEKVHSIEMIDAVKATEKYKDKDILIISWSPYDDHTICEVCDEWGTDKPIIYIGEQDGCNAPEEFFENFEVPEGAPEFGMKSWDGIHDVVLGKMEKEAYFGIT